MQLHRQEGAVLTSCLSGVHLVRIRRMVITPQNCLLMSSLRKHSPKDPPLTWSKTEISIYITYLALALLYAMDSVRRLGDELLAEGRLKPLYTGSSDNGVIYGHALLGSLPFTERLADWSDHQWNSFRLNLSSVVVFATLHTVASRYSVELPEMNDDFFHRCIRYYMGPRGYVAFQLVMSTCFAVYLHRAYAAFLMGALLSNKVLVERMLRPGKDSVQFKWVVARGE